MMADPIICRCEGVRLSQIHDAIRHWDAHTWHEIKIITRAGQGACQGRTCALVVVHIVMKELGRYDDDVAPVRLRFPVRLVPLEAMIDESITLLLDPGESYLPVYSAFKLNQEENRGINNGS